MRIALFLNVVDGVFYTGRITSVCRNFFKHVVDGSLAIITVVWILYKITIDERETNTYGCKKKKGFECFSNHNDSNFFADC